MSKQITHWRLALAILVVLSLFVAACGTEEPAAAPEPTEAAAADSEAAEAVEPTDAVEEEEPAEEEEVVLRIGGLEVVDCWNPWGCHQIFLFGDIVYESFTGHGPADTGCTGVPRLAESWEVSEDGRTWTIKLHEGITYSDGTVFDANEAKAYLEWVAGSELAAWFAETLALESVEVIDDLTLSYTTTDPILNSPDYDWQWIYFGPTDLWSSMPPEELAVYENYPPIGTGPYEVTEYEPGQYIVYDARDDYYLGKPPIDKIVYQIYTSTDTLVNALLSGEIDLTLVGLPPDVFDQVAADPNISIEEKYPGSVHMVYFNMAEGGMKHPAIDDPVVREAIDYAIDKEKIVELALLGHGITCPTNWACGPYYEATGELNPELKVIPLDVEKANDLLQEAGYVDSGGDGIRETPDGEQLEFRLYYQVELPSHLAIADMLKEMLDEIGIAVSVEAQEYGTWASLVQGDRDFDMALGFEPPDVDAASMDLEWSCWSAEAGMAGLNRSGYCNPESDDMVYAYWFATDKEEGQQAIWEAQAMKYSDRPKIDLAGQMGIQAWRNDRFDFPLGGCDISAGVWDYPTILQAEVK